MWTDAIPNLLIGLREGLEAGLVVSILLAAVRKTEPAAGAGSRRVSSAPVWLGVLGAVMLAGSFAAVLTYSTSVLSSGAQEAVGGLLSVLAVGLVTGMVFWMRRTAAGLAAHLRGEVQRAVAIGAGALTITAFLAVGREGLETTLFLWAAVRASGSTLAPLARRRPRPGGRGGAVLAAVPAGRSAGRRRVLQPDGDRADRDSRRACWPTAWVTCRTRACCPGGTGIAFDLTVHVDPGSWWVSIVTGVTELAPKMTVLQVVAWVAYLAVVIPAFIRAGPPGPAVVRRRPARPAAGAAAAGSGWPAQRTWAVAGVLVVVSVLAAGAAIAALPAAGATATTAVTVTRDGCARDWTSAGPGTQTFTVRTSPARPGRSTWTTRPAGWWPRSRPRPGDDADMTATLGRRDVHDQCYPVRAGR